MAQAIRRLFSTSFIVWLVAISWLAACSQQEKLEEAPKAVRTQQVKLQKTEDVHIFTGTAEADVESRLSFKVGGTLQQIPVSVGDKVREGELLAQLDTKDYEIKVQEAQASLDQGLAQVKNASANYERVRRLYENQNASRNELDVARAQAEATSASVRFSEKQLELARLQLGYARLTAPSSCAVAAVDSKINENVAAGQTVMVLTCGSKLQVKTVVPEVLIGHIRKGEEVQVKFDAIPDHTFKGKVTEVGVAATGAATTFPVKILLEEEESLIRSGMVAEVIFTWKKEESVRIIVPSSAVGEDREGNFVWVLVPKDKNQAALQRRLVRPGKLTPNGMEILEGLQEGEWIVIAGISHLRPQQIVKFNPS